MYLFLCQFIKLHLIDDEHSVKILSTDSKESF